MAAHSNAVRDFNDSGQTDATSLAKSQILLDLSNNKQLCHDIGRMVKLEAWEAYKQSIPINDSSRDDSH